MEVFNHSGEVCVWIEEDWVNGVTTSTTRSWGSRGGPVGEHPMEPNSATVIGTWGVSWHSKSREGVSAKPYSKAAETALFTTNKFHIHFHLRLVQNRFCVRGRLKRGPI